CYAPKMGRGAIDPVRLLKLLLLGEHYALADEKLMQMAQVPFQVAVVSAKVRSREAAATWKGCCTLHHHAQRIRQYFQ
ncbi:MAG: hypothetical protein HOP19_27120, partial [Acidobacteria bacterium]|nr:hypothetical protein [Acidobacteriota bacterium]